MVIEGTQKPESRFQKPIELWFLVSGFWLLRLSGSGFWILSTYTALMHSLEAFLEQHHIAVTRFDHAPVFTVEESSKLPPMPGAPTKNLLLRDEGGKRYILVTVGHEKRVDLKALRKMLGMRKTSFAPPEDLRRLLGVEPGSVTFLGLMNDRAHQVEFVIDQSLWDAEEVQCHPLVNSATVVIPHEGLKRFLEATGHTPRIIDVPAM